MKRISSLPLKVILVGTLLTIALSNQSFSGNISDIPDDFQFTKFLREGDRGNEVKYLQIVLNAEGHNAGAEDGIFGPNTKAAVERFQEAEGLVVDGLVGQNTRRELNKVLDELRRTDSKPTVDSFDVTPNEITLGHSFTISYTVSDDIGLDRVELWRTNDSNGSPDDNNWTEIKRTSLSGQRRSGSFTDTPSSTGIYWYGMHVVDNAGQWNTEGEHGPEKGIVEESPPDLIVQSRSVTSSEPYYPNSSLSLSCIIKNQGQGSAGPSKVKYYLSTSSTGTTYYLGYDSVSSLSSEGTSSESETVTIPSNITTDRNYYVVFYADADGQVSESNENNNKSNAGTIYIEPPQPDLIAQSPNITSSGPYYPGSSLSISCTIKNQGQGSADSSRVEYYLSTSSTGTDYYLGFDSVSSLNAGSTSSESETMTIPSNITTDRNYYVVFYVDADGEVSESIENNNKRNAGTIYVSPRVAHPIITAPLQLSSGPYFVDDTITATFTIKNEGSASITFQVLTVGGRLNGVCPGDVCPDFTQRTLTLNPNESYNYQGSLTLSQAGNYHFFCTYQTPDGNWNTNVDLAPGLSDYDRIEDIVVRSEANIIASEPNQTGLITFSGPFPLSKVNDYWIADLTVRNESGLWLEFIPVLADRILEIDCIGEAVQGEAFENGVRFIPPGEEITYKVEFRNDGDKFQVFASFGIKSGAIDTISRFGSFLPKVGEVSELIGYVQEYGNNESLKKTLDHISQEEYLRAGWNFKDFVIEVVQREGLDIALDTILGIAKSIFEELKSLGTKITYMIQISLGENLPFCKFEISGIEGGMVTHAPSVFANDASDIDVSSATLNGYLANTGGEASQVWFEYGTSTNYEFSTEKVRKSTADSFKQSLSNLNENTIYHFRACASNSKGKIYGLDQTFKTSASSQLPTASSTDIVDQPQTMNPDTAYSVSAKYSDPDGRNDLKFCYLRFNHPSKPLTMMWSESGDWYDSWEGEEGKNYLTITDVTSVEIDNGYQLTWKFKIKDSWPSVSNAIDFGVYAWDDEDQKTDWNYDNTNASFTIPPSDTTAPPAPINLTVNPSSWTNDKNFTIDWTNPDDPSGIAKTYYKLGSVPTSNTDGTFTTSKPFSITATTEGEQTIYVWLMDGADNIDHNNQSSTTLYYDATAPNNPTSCTEIHGVQRNVEQSNVNDPDFTWSGASDSASGVDGYYYYWGTNSSGISTNYTTSTGYDPSPVTEDTYYLRIKTKDNADNESSWTTLFVFIYKEPEDTGTITVTIHPDNLPNVTFNISGPTDYSGSGTSWTKTNAPAGDYTISYGDVDGYTKPSPSSETKILQADDSISFEGTYVDNISPTGTITILNDAEKTDSRSVALTLSADDTGSGMEEGAQMKFSNDESSWSTPESYSTTKQWTLTSGNGTKTVYVKFKDAAGNWSDSINDTITLDTTQQIPKPKPPVLASPQNNASDQSISLTLSWNASEGATSYRLQVADNPGFSNPIFDHSSTTGTSQEVSGLSGSTEYWWRVNASNSKGTSSWSDSWHFTTIAVSPQAPISVRVEDARASPGQTVSIPIEIGDVTDLDVISCELTLNYDANILTAEEATTTGALSEDWGNPTYNITNGQIVVWMAGSTGLSGSGNLVKVGFEVKSSARPGETSPLSLSGVSFNEGAVSTTTYDGVFTAGGRWGDVSEDGTISAYDAALVLRYGVGLATLGSSQQKVADVSGDGTVSAYDAAWILRYGVGLITSFPVEESSAAPAISSFKISDYRVRLSSAPYKPGTTFSAEIQLENASGILASEMVLLYDQNILTPVRVKTPTSGHLLHHSAKDGKLRIWLAGTQAFEGSGSVVSLIFKVNESVAAQIKSHLTLSQLKFNEVSLAKNKQAFFRVQPYRFRLLQSYPNPLNPETWIPYELAEPAEVIIKIYNSSGRMVRILNYGHKEAGLYFDKGQAAYWNGRNTYGERVTSGIYFYQIQAGKQMAVRKMTVLK